MTNDAELVEMYGRIVAETVNTLPDFKIPITLVRYPTIGPVLTDAIFQAGISYKNVVAPRVNRLIAEYPEACATTDRFLSLLSNSTTYDLFCWRGDEKPRRLLDLTEWLLLRQILTIHDLREWLKVESQASALIEIKGIGPKTLDYLKNLVGLPTVAVDRHIMSFVSAVGVPITDYKTVRDIVRIAAEILAIRADCLDYAIWSYVSSPSRI